VQLDVNASFGDTEHRIAWLSLQADGSVSVGLAARTFISRRFLARYDVWNADNRVADNYLISHSPDELEPVRNPHFTFHPLATFQLRANDDEILFQGLADVGLIVEDVGRFPWIRMVSGPIRELPRPGSARHPPPEVISVLVPSQDISLGLGVDFVSPGAGNKSGALVERFLDVGNHRLHLFIETLEAQQPTLSWYHEH
jgi:hypothetical protein